MKKAKKIFGDVLGIRKVLGTGYAIRWATGIVFRMREILSAGNLQAADLAMGVGPFRVSMRRYGVDFLVTGTQGFSGIREMYVRDTYLRNGVLKIKDGDVVVDLGANMGNFTNLALAHGSRVRVIAVEPSKKSNMVFWRSVGLNSGFTDRVTLVRSFLGQCGDKQSEMKTMPEYQDALFLSEAELVESANIDRVDFLKCDIEGGEYGLLGPESILLRMARKLAIEIHSFAGDVGKFIEMLKQQGFEIKYIQRDPDGTATVLASRA